MGGLPTIKRKMQPHIMERASLACSMLRGLYERIWVQVRMWNIGCLSGRGDVYEELRKRMIDMCCLQEVRWRGQGARMLGMNERKYKLWLSGNGDGVGGVGVIVKGKLCEKVLEEGYVMTVVVVEEDVLRLICGYARKVEEV